MPRLGNDLNRFALACLDQPMRLPIVVYTDRQRVHQPMELFADGWQRWGVGNGLEGREKKRSADAFRWQSSVTRLFTSFLAALTGQDHHRLYIHVACNHDPDVFR